MKTEFKSSFAKDLKKIRDRDLLEQVKAVIEQVERASSLQDVEHVKQLKGGSSYYRIRLGDHRLGLTISGDVVSFVRLLHRREIYRYFP